MVLLPGWGSAARVFAPLAARLAAFAELQPEELPLPADTVDGFHPLDRALRVLAERLPPRAVLIGWSLGGALATLFAARHPGRVAALVCIASNPCFRAREDWPLGMPAAEFDAFVAGFDAEPEAQLLRFAALQAMGGRDARKVSRALQAARADAGTAALRRGLEMLETLDLRGVSPGTLPVLRIFGAKDRLVPVALAAAQRAESWVLPEAAHAPFLSHPEAVAARILDFLLGELAAPSPMRDKRDVARSFGRAAGGYDAAARLQRDCGERLQAMLPPDADPARVL
ncbi:MAG: alpha/beta fold hydrolase, partial [Gammaproteobacteria bacterium]